MEREKEVSSTRQEAFEQRIKDVESARTSAEDICQAMQKENAVTRAEAEHISRTLEQERERGTMLGKELTLRNNENERLANRINDQRAENGKLAKLVEELTSNLENLQRQRRESDALLRNLRGELGMANKARKASEIQMENYRTSIRQLEEQSAIKNAENERLNEQLRGKVEDEAALKSKKRGLKASLNEIEETKRNLELDLAQTQRATMDQKTRIKTVKTTYDVISHKVLLYIRCYYKLGVIFTP